MAAKAGSRHRADLVAVSGIAQENRIGPVPGMMKVKSGGEGT